MNVDIVNLKSSEKTNNNIKNVILILSFTIAMIMSSYIKIPLFPVPFTMQTFVVVLSGFIISNKKACISQIIYLLYGIAGAAVFANGGGIGYIVSPTFGYILGFIVMAYVVGSIMGKQDEKNITLKSLVIIGVVGVIIQHIIGVVYLYVISNTIFNTNISCLSAITNGSLIFLPYDILKVTLAGFIIRQVKN